MSYRQHVRIEMTLLLVVGKIVIDPKWFHWISLHLCDSMNIFMLMCDTPPNPFDFSFKAIVSHLSL